jgi:hypothetical protein
LNLSCGRPPVHRAPFPHARPLSEYSYTGCSKQVTHEAAESLGNGAYVVLYVELNKRPKNKVRGVVSAAIPQAVKTTIRLGRSERRTESYVEGLSDAGTQPAVVFTA